MKLYQRRDKFLLIVIVVLFILPFIFLLPFGIQQFVKSYPQRQAASQIPRYESAKEWKTESSCQDATGGGPCSSHIIFKTDDSIEQVFSFYKERLTSDGWEIKFENYLVDGAGNKLPDKYVGFTKNNDTAQLTFHSRKSTFDFSINRK